MASGEMAGMREIRRIETTDFLALSELYEQVYSVRLDPPYWRWKYLENPAGAVIAYVMTEVGRVVGDTVAIAARAKCGEREYPVGQVCDITVHPDYRTGSTLLKLARLTIREGAASGQLFFYGFSVPVTRRISEKMLKFKSVCKVVRFVIVLNAGAYVRGARLPVAVARVAGALGRLALWLRTRSRYVEWRGKVVEIDRFDDRFDRLWLRRRNDYRIAVVRDATYLNWRYADHPTKTYTKMASVSGDDVEGFVVLGMEVDRVRRGLLMDLVVDPERPDLRDCLLSAAIDRLASQKADVVEMWLPEASDLVDVFRRWGFVRRETRHHLVVRPLQEDGGVSESYFLDPRNWHLTLGDSDYH